MMRLGRWTARGLAAAGALTLVACGGLGSLTSVDLKTPPGDLNIKMAPGELTGQWRLLSLQESGRPEVTIPEPDRFTAEFIAEGLVALKADCNRCASGYTSSVDRLSVGPLACTRAACSSAPLDTTYAGLVGKAATWSATADRLELRSDAGLLRFGR